MSNSNVIKEFLVSLGYKVDEVGFKRFVGGVDRATKAVAGLGVATEVAAAAVVASVTKISKNFEDLYYASQRIHASVENINAAEFAFTQVGGSAQGARAAMENIAEFMRSNPGGERFLMSLGVQTRDANNELRDTTDILRDLGKQFRGMPYFAAKVRAGVLGIDERTLQAMIRGTDEFSDKYHQMAQKVGVDQQAAAKASHDFMVDLRTLLALLILNADKVLLKVQPVLHDITNGMIAADQATHGLSTTAAALFVTLGPLLFLMRGFVGALFQALGGMELIGAAIGLLSNPVGWVLILIGAIAALLSTSKEFRQQFAAAWDEAVKSVGGSLTELSGAFSHLMTALQPIIDWLGNALEWLRKRFAAAVGPAVIGLVRNAMGFLVADLKVVADIVNMIANLLQGKWSDAWKNAGSAARNGLAALRALFFGPAGGAKAPPGTGEGARPAPGPTASPAAAGASPGGIDGQIRAFFRSKGIKDHVALGITAGIGAESQFNASAVNPKSGAYGIGQWLGTRKRELFRRYGSRPNLQQQLEFMLWELQGGDHGGKAVLGQGSAEGALDAYVRKFMRPGAGAETTGDLNRGSQYLSRQLNRPVMATGAAAPVVSVTQKTDIHVNGAADAAAVGRNVANEQGRVNGNLVRNTRGALS